MPPSSPPPSDRRPPIVYETTDTLGSNSAFVVRLSKAKLTVPRVSVQIGVPKEGRLSPFVPLASLDDLIATLTKIRDEQAPALLADINKARLAAEERQRRYVEDDARRQADWQKQSKRGKNREFTGSDDMRKAKQRSERARQEQERLLAHMRGEVPES